MLTLALLGEQTIVDDATGTVRTASSRALALAAFLVFHAGTPQSRGRIAAQFWPDSTDAQALTNLRRELHHLRHALGDDPSLVVTVRDLCWRDTQGCLVDLRTFSLQRQAALDADAVDDTPSVLRHATSAVEQLRGDLLPGVYDDWVLDARSDLARQGAVLCDLLSRARTRTGDLPGAVAAARRRIQLQPLEEVGYRNLMQAQADLGDRAGAVSTYHHCASVLERELGLDPDKVTRTTLERLLIRASPVPAPLPVHDPAAGRPRLAPDRPGPATGRSGLAAAPLVGRSTELGLLESLWRTAAAGRPGLVVVSGDAGVGKSRLVTEVADRAAALEGAVVATTQCFGTSGRLALSPVADWLRHPAVQSASAALPPVWRAEVDRLVPSSEDGAEPGSGSRAMVDAWQRHRFFEGMARALVGVGRPTLLVLDNLQWCDQETLAFLTFSLALTDDTPFMVAATLRGDSLDEHPELGDWTARMRAGGRLSELSIGPLDAPDAGRLAAAICGRPLQENETRLLQAMTGGYPLYVVEAARTSADLGATHLPAGDLTAVLRSRLAQVTPAVRDIAGLAAAVGRNFTLELLTEASDLDADTVVRAVDELWRRRIVRELRDGYDFSHDLLRDAAYAQVSPARRWLLHRRLAQGLELLHAGHTDAVSAQLAQQYARGGRPERALGYYRRAAGIAADRFAHAEAVRLHREALSLVLTLPEGPDRDRQELDVLEAMAAPLNALYGYASPELHTTFARSIALAEQLGRRQSSLNAHVGLWTTQFVRGDLDGGHRTVTRALTLVDPDSELSGAAHFAFGGSAVSLGMPAQALHHFERAAELSGGQPMLTVGTRADVHGAAWAAHAHWLLGHSDEAVSSCSNAIALARTIGHPYSLAVALAYAGITHQLRGDLAALGDTVTELRDLCDRYGFAYYNEWGLILDGWCHQDESGVVLTRRGIGNLKAQGSFTRMPYWLSLLADLTVRSGQPVTASAVLDAALVDGRARHDRWWLPEVMRMRAAYDDPSAAVVRLEAAAQMAGVHGSVALLRRCEQDLAERGAGAARRTVGERPRS